MFALEQSLLIADHEMSRANAKRFSPIGAFRGCMARDETRRRLARSSGCREWRPWL